MTFRHLLLRVVLVALIAALAGAAAFVFSKRQAEEYEATTSVLLSASTIEVRALGVNLGSDNLERRLANDVLEVSSFDVARSTAAKLDDPSYTPDAVAAAVSVSNAQGSDVVTISARADDPAQAAALAAEYRRQAILRRRKIVTRRAENAREALLAALGRLPREGRRGARGDSLRTQIGAVEILAATGDDPLIVEGVRTSAEPVSPKTQRNVLFGLLFGAVLGLGLVALRGAPARPGGALPAERRDGDAVPADESAPA